jgi:hypothetical protein
MVGAALVVVFVCQAAQATIPYEYTDVSAASGSMESVFGTKVAELDASAYGFNFLFRRDGMGVGYDDPFHGHRNLNVITEVFVATQAISLGTGSGGSPIELQPGDYTFAYTLDYATVDNIFPDSAVRDFQILRTLLGVSPPVANPGPNMAMGAISAGAYNTNLEFGNGAGTAPIQSMAGEALDFGVFVADSVEYDWGANLVNPQSKAMVLMFTSPDVQVWQVGWGSQGGQSLATMAQRQAVGHTGEGGGTLGGGEAIPDSIPVLIPVIPEPATLALVIGGALALVRRRR